jgi:hypothetical protein
MSLREQWNAAREQRQQEIQLRQQQVQESRDRTQKDLSEIQRHRETMAKALQNSLSEFHSTLQTTVATMREYTRSQQQQDWRAARQQRESDYSAIREYVWGKAPQAATKTPPQKPTPASPQPKKRSQ